VAQTKPIVSLPSVLNPHWVSGFVTGGGSFILATRKKTAKINNRFGLYWNFSITQHSKDFELMKLFILFFNCGKVSRRSKKEILRCDFYIQDVNSIRTKVIPHFDNYPLCNIKELDFLNFKLILDMVYYKKHLIKENQVIIQKMINNMNIRRV